MSICICVIAGCGRDTVSNPAPADDMPDSPPAGTVSTQAKPADPGEPSADSTEAKVELSVASWDEVQTKVAEQKGKVVVVDLWSTSCLPCVLELPKLAVLQRQHPDSVVCMSVSLDYTGAAEETPESHREKVMKILKTRNMTVQNFISSTSDLDIYDKIDLASIPAVLVYDREGQLLKRFDNDMNDYGEEGFTYADHIVPLVEQTLGEG